MHSTNDGRSLQVTALRQAASCVLLGLLVTAPAFAARCLDEDTPLSMGSSSGKTNADNAALHAGDPRSQLQSVALQAIARSQSVGATRVLADAAEQDLAAQRAARLPQAALTGSGGYTQTSAPDVNSVTGMQAMAGLRMQAPLWDSGKQRELEAWRSQLLQSARQGQINAEEQVALQAVALALDRSRYQLQSQVYTQYVRRMACLSEALETIVKADKGRASELVQAQKTTQQAELALEQAKTALAQTEVRLRRYIGEPLPGIAGLSSVLSKVPSLPEMQRDAIHAAEIVQLDANASAAERLAASIAAGFKPQVGWNIGSHAVAGAGRSNHISAMVTLTVPIFDQTAEPTSRAAQQRAQAARLQRDDVLELRQSRMADMHEAATSAFDRARRYVDVLRNSERVRASTLQQWQQLGKRSLFDVMAAEGDYYSTRIAHVNSLFDGEQAIALLYSLGRGVTVALR